MAALNTSVEINSRMSASTGSVPVKALTNERSTRVMRAHARPSCIWSACVQKRMTDLKTSGVPRIKSLIVVLVGWIFGCIIIAIAILDQKRLGSGGYCYLLSPGSSICTTSVTQLNVSWRNMLSFFISSTKSSSSLAALLR